MIPVFFFIFDKFGRDFLFGTVLNTPYGHAYWLQIHASSQNSTQCNFFSSCSFNTYCKKRMKSFLITLSVMFLLTDIETHLIFKSPESLNF